MVSICFSTFLGDTRYMLLHISRRRVNMTHLLGYRQYLRPGASSGKAFGYGLNSPRSPSGGEGGENFLYSFVSRQALGPSQPPIKWVPWLSGIKTELKAKPSYVFLVPWLRISAPLSPHYLWASKACISDTFTFKRWYLISIILHTFVSSESI